MKDSGIMKNDLRLHVFLAKCGFGSRRGCETIIKQGRVTINGHIVTEMGKKISPDDIITLDGKKIHYSKKKVYIALNKPSGYLCSNFDKSNRPIALDLLKNVSNTRLFHVGRLDFNSSGLIFYSNDGDFSEIVTHPSYKIEKEYYIEASRVIPEKLLQLYCNGITIDNVKYILKNYVILDQKSAVLTLFEGKNREIKRVFENSNIFIKKIERRRIGIVKLKNIQKGKYRYLTKKEVEWFLNRKKT